MTGNKRSTLKKIYQIDYQQNDAIYRVGSGIELELHWWKAIGHMLHFLYGRFGSKARKRGRREV